MWRLKDNRLDRGGRTLEPEFLDGDFLEQMILGERLLPRSRRIHLGARTQSILPAVLLCTP